MLQTIYHSNVFLRRYDKNYFKSVNCYSYTTRYGYLPYFDLDVPDHNRTKIVRIRFLTFFGSTMPDIKLESQNHKKWKKFCKKLFYGLWLNYRPGYVPRTPRWGCVPSCYIKGYMGTSWGRHDVFQGRPQGVFGT